VPGRKRSFSTYLPWTLQFYSAATRPCGGAHKKVVAYFDSEMREQGLREQGLREQGLHGSLIDVVRWRRDDVCSKVVVVICAHGARITV
jgi:hypothetical protein